MAGVDRMAIEEVVRKVLVDEHADVLKESLRWLVAQLMQIEVSELIGAEHGQRTPDRATANRPREWQTRAGTVELQIPRSVRAATSRASCSPESAESALAGGRPPAPDPT
jgi:putative transposase